VFCYCNLLVGVCTLVAICSSAGPAIGRAMNRLRSWMPQARSQPQVDEVGVNLISSFRIICWHLVIFTLQCGAIWNGCTGIPNLTFGMQIFWRATYRKCLGQALGNLTCCLGFNQWINGTCDKLVFWFMFPTVFHCPIFLKWMGEAIHILLSWSTFYIGKLLHKNLHILKPVSSTC
jgi:hypothetical protein